MDVRSYKPDMDILKKIYSLYHETMDWVDPVCKKKCASCCTCNVTLTSLEAGFVMNSLGIDEKKDLQIRIRQRFPVKRYIPEMTTNGFARMCMENIDIPEEENDPSWGACPLLEDDLCTVYEARPFGCRSLLSEVHCGQDGYARIPPLGLTLNTLFLQAIEHLDEKGFSGNLSDMLLFFLSEKGVDDMTDRSNDITGKRVFMRNEKIPVLMVPPEHQKTFKTLIRELLGLLSRLTYPQ